MGRLGAEELPDLGQLVTPLLHLSLQRQVVLLQLYVLLEALLAALSLCLSVDGRDVQGGFEQLPHHLLPEQLVVILVLCEGYHEFMEVLVIAVLDDALVLA